MPPWSLTGAPTHVLVEAPCSALAVDTVPNDYAQPVEALSSALVRRPKTEDQLGAGRGRLLFASLFAFACRLFEAVCFLCVYKTGGVFFSSCRLIALSSCVLFLDLVTATLPSSTS